MNEVNMWTGIRDFQQASGTNGKKEWHFHHNPSSTSKTLLGSNLGIFVRGRCFSCCCFFSFPHLFELFLSRVLNNCSHQNPQRVEHGRVIDNELPLKNKIFLGGNPHFIFTKAGEENMMDKICIKGIQSGRQRPPTWPCPVHVAGAHTRASISWGKLFGKHGTD